MVEDHFIIYLTLLNLVNLLNTEKQLIPESQPGIKPM